jgi:hypothetical protein
VNEAQTVNRAEVRELADLYFARLATLVDERLAAAEVRLEAKLDRRIGGSEARLEAKLDQRFHAVQLEIAGLRVEVATQMRGQMREMRDQLKWMFVFWAGTLVPLAGLMLALGKGWL